MSPDPGTPQHRTTEQLRHHYEVERELADRLRKASGEERLSLYSSVYNELFRRVPDHPQLSRKASALEIHGRVSRQMMLLRDFLHRESTYLEIGPGDCTLAFEVARSVKKVFAVDVSGEITSGMTPPPNFQLILSDGRNIPLPRESVDVAYSNQLMEHLHPDDALEQLRNVYDTLKPGGAYICVTPSRLTGPHDISRYFDAVATGFHLREYTVGELRDLFLAVGFSKVRSLSRIGPRYLGLPVLPIAGCERLLDSLPARWRRAVADRPPLRPLLGVRLIGVK
ncbi:MAG TPA: class I SAM-dependent methyltransferase [Thermoanaerobaculia bacterium]